MLTGRTVLVTGGAGFIGTTLARALLPDNDVVVFDNFARDALSASALAGHSQLTVKRGDVVDAAAVQALIELVQPTHIVHCAAIAGIDTVIESPTATLEVNILGTANVLRAASVARRLERVVCFSTSEVFGRHAFLSNEETNAVIGAVGEARWTYAVSKLAGEHLALAYHREQGMPTVVLRPFNVYGPGQVGEGALSTFIQRALRDEDIVIHGDGTQIRAWCYVDDMVRAVLAALERPAAVGEAFNIGNARAVTTVYGLANTVIRLLGSASAVRFVPKKSADVELRVPNVDKARRLIGFESAVDLESGIPLSAEFYRRIEADR